MRIFKYLLGCSAIFFAIPASAIVICSGEVSHIQVEQADSFVLLAGHGWKKIGSNSGDATKARLSLLLSAKATNSPVYLYFADSVDCQSHDYTEVPLKVRL